MKYEEIEMIIKTKGLTAPRITLERINEVIVDEQYHVFEGTTITVCCLHLQNGFKVIGESACASPENFDIALGQQIAKDNARQKIWALEGYAFKKHTIRQITMGIQISSYYTDGYNAAWRGLTPDDMPKFKRQDRAALWLKGHADGLRSCTEHKQLLHVNKPGMKRMCDVMRDALAKAQGV